MTRIAWFSSITKELPLRSSAFTRAVLEQAPRHWDVEVFVPDEDWAEYQTAPKLNEFPVQHYLRAYLRDRQAPFDVFIYQLEDHERCRFALDSLRIFGGVACAHDLSYNRIELGRYQHNTTGSDLNRDIEKRFGHNAARLGDVLVRGWPVEVYDRLYPCGADDWSKTAALIVFERRLAEIVKDQIHTASLASATFPLRMLDSKEVAQQRKTERAAIEIAENDFVVGYAGERPVEDRVTETLMGFQRMLRSLADKSETRFHGGAVRFLWLVSSEQGELIAQREVERLATLDREAASCVRVIRTFDVSEFRSLISIFDVFCGLHVHEYHGIPCPTYWCMAYGVPCVINGIEDDATFPAQVCAALPVGGNESRALAGALLELASNPHYREQLSRSSRAYVQSCCDPALVAQDLQYVFTEYRGRIRKDAQARHARYRAAEADYLKSINSDTMPLLTDDGIPSLDSSTDSVHSQASQDFSWDATHGDE